MIEPDVARWAIGGTGGIIALAGLMRLWLSARGLLRHDAAGEHTADYYLRLIKAQSEEIARLRTALAECEKEASASHRREHSA